MRLYQYCVTYADDEGVKQTSGSIEVRQRLKTNDDYNRLVEDIASSIDKERKDIVVNSLNMIGRHGIFR